jgi:hypothetical protein
MMAIIDALLIAACVVVHTSAIAVAGTALYYLATRS